MHALTTLRHGAGASQAPFDTLNLGNCSTADGDDPDVVARNRESLVDLIGLPSPPRWLKQVHGVEVARFHRVVAHDADAHREGIASGTFHQTDPDTASSLSSARHARNAFAQGPAGDTTPSQRVPSLPLSGEQSVEKGSVAETLASARTEGDQAPPTADAAVTLTPAVVLAILTADCLPVVFAAVDGSEIAVAHAGWRGLAAGVLEATVAAMKTPPERVLAWLGPAAGPQAYEIGAEVRDAFVALDARDAGLFVDTRPGHWHVDLYALARRRLVQSGLGNDRVHGGGLCTISDPARFFSHRRDARSGRMATLAWITPG